MFALIRKELATLHGLVKNQETAAETVTFERVAVLHDRIADVEGALVVIGTATLRDLLKIAVTSGTVPDATLKEVEASLVYADRRQGEISAVRAQAVNVRTAAAARAALATPEAKVELPAAPVAVPAETPPAQSDASTTEKTAS